MRVWQVVQKKFPWFHAATLTDWVIAVALLVVAWQVGERVDPYHLFLPDSSDNPALAYPFIESSVPMWLAFLVGDLFPVLCFVLMQFFFKLAMKKWDIAHDLYNSCLGLLESAAFTTFVVETIKLFAGRHRPHYLAVRDDPAKEFDGRKSFPSGHSATVFCGLGFLTFYLAGKLRVLSGHGGYMYRALPLGIPLYVALVIAVSRTRDYHHNYSDIVAGGIIGLACACVGYFLNFPSLLNEHSYAPINRRNPHGLPLSELPDKKTGKTGDIEAQQSTELHEVN